MNIQQFEYVLAVARYRHFETAADHCYISQSTLSTMISRFEDELGVMIFNRKKKPVAITREGEEIIERLTIIVREIGRLDELVKEMKGEVKGTVRIACLPTVAPYLLPLFLHDFSTRYPELQLVLKESSTQDIVRQLKSRELDIGILSPPLHEEEIREYPIYKESFVLYNTAGKNSKKIDIEDMEWDNFWLLEEGHCMTDQVLKICSMNKKKINSSLNIHFKAGSIDSLMRFVKAYKGKTMLPYLSVRNLPAEEARYISLFKQPVPDRTIALVTHQHFVRKRILQLLQYVIREKVKLMTPNIRLINDK